MRTDRIKKILLIILLTLFAITICFAQENCIKIHVIDIGEGDAILIQTKDKNVLIDTGNILSGYKLVNYLRENNVETINHLIITHYDLDHICGLFFIIPQFKVEKTYDNGLDLGPFKDSVLYYYEEILRNKTNYSALKEGDLLKLEDASLEVLWPQEKPHSGSFNHNSLLVMLKVGGLRCLLTGDLDQEAESELLTKETDLAADILKAAHHGAQDASSEAFIKKVKPKISLISVDRDNRRGYPSERVLKLLQECSSKVYRTDEDGSIVITIDKDGYRVNTIKEPSSIRELTP